MKQSNFSTGSMLILTSLIIVFLTFGLASAASAQDYRYTGAKDGFASCFFGGQTAAYDSDLSLIAEGYHDTYRQISNYVVTFGEM